MIFIYIFFFIIFDDLEMFGMCCHVWVSILCLLDDIFMMECCLCHSFLKHSTNFVSNHLLGMILDSIEEFVGSEIPFGNQQCQYKWLCWSKQGLGHQQPQYKIECTSRWHVQFHTSSEWNTNTRGLDHLLQIQKQVQVVLIILRSNHLLILWLLQQLIHYGLLEGQPFCAGSCFYWCNTFTSIETMLEKMSKFNINLCGETFSKVYP